MSTPVTWRGDIDALAFRLDGRQGYCMIHRRAFRALLGFNPAPADCESFFHAHVDAFEGAADAKIRKKNIAGELNFHLTSRDVARQLRLAKRPRLG